MIPDYPQVRALMFSLPRSSSLLRDLFCLIYKSLFFPFTVLEARRETPASPASAVNPQLFFCIKHGYNSPVSSGSTYPGKHVTPIQQSYYTCSQHLHRRDLALSSPLLYLLLGLPGHKLSQPRNGSYPNASPIFAANLGKRVT